MRSYVHFNKTHENHRPSSYASRILISNKGKGSGDKSRQNEARIFEIRQKLSEQVQKNPAVPLFSGGF
jgi:hypothetical protein